MEGKEAGCPCEAACGPAADPRAVGSWAPVPLGGRVMPQEEPWCSDGSQKKQA